MKVLIAIDSFKGSLTSYEAGTAAEEGIKRVFPDAYTEVVAIADGGEGTVDSLISSMNSKKVAVSATDALGRKINCFYGITATGTALIEIAAAAGITLLKPEELNPLLATTYGVGEIIKDALEKGCRDFIIGIGGSATNDGGVGMLQALGFEFLDETGKEISRGAQGLKDIQSIYCRKANEKLLGCTFRVACDVNNPLCGETGCSYIFSPQKGATTETAKKMDSYLLHFAEKTKEINPLSDKDFPGAGAAGGLGFAFMSYLGAELVSGTELIMSLTDIEDKIKEVDLVITGEGRIDSQTVMGKVPGGVAKLSKKYGKPVIAFSGAVTESAVLCNEKGIDAFFPIIRNITSLEDAMNKETASENMADCTEQVFRLIKAIQ